MILCYHAVSEGWPETVAVTSAALERQLRRFVRAGYRGATFTEAINGSLAGRLLVVTFDDAYRSGVEHGGAVLSRLGIPGTVFVPTRHVGEDKRRSWLAGDRWLSGPWEDELLGASWEQLRRLAAAGWEIGSHGRSHRRLPELDDDALAEELEGSRADCEDSLRRPCRSIAYPYGEADERVARAAREAGYSAGGTLSTSARPPDDGPDPMRWPRLGIHRSDGWVRLRAKAALHRSPRALRLVRRVRPRALGGV